MENTDQLLTHQIISRIHFRVERQGLPRAMTEFGEREPALLAYALCSASTIASITESAGASKPQAKAILELTMVRMLVLMECTREAHVELWRDMIGDEPAGNDKEGDNHE